MLIQFRIPDELIAYLKKRADSHSNSLSVEAKDILIEQLHKDVIVEVGPILKKWSQKK